jgi:hypothetical protein
VGGDFAVMGGVAASRIARWSGGAWSPLGAGVLDTSSARVMALAVHDDGTGAALFAGGDIASWIESSDSHLAKWGCPDTTPPELACPEVVAAADRPDDGPGEVVTFAVTALDALDPAPLVECVPPSGSFFPQGTTWVLCTATDASGNEATCSFPVVVREKTRPRRL